jgi:hypothetical protein
VWYVVVALGKLGEGADLLLLSVPVVRIIQRDRRQREVE